MTYPCHVYKSPGPYRLRGKSYACVTVNDDEEMQARLAQGWHKTRDEAWNPPEKAVEVPADDAEPTRAELEQKAAELGIKFDGRTSDKTLARKIKEALP